MRSQWILTALWDGEEAQKKLMKNKEPSDFLFILELEPDIVSLHSFFSLRFHGLSEMR